MSKGISNLYDFNVTCGECGSDNIDAEERDGYIYLVCNNCAEKEDYEKEENEKLEIFEDDLNKENKIIKSSLYLKNKKDLNSYLNTILEHNKKSLIIMNDIYKILKSDYEKDNENGGFVYKRSSFKKDIFKISEKLKGLAVFNNFVVNNNSLFIELSMYENIVFNTESNVYEIGQYYYALEISTDVIDTEINETYKSSSDEIFAFNELKRVINELNDYIEKLEKYLEDSK